MQTGEGVMEIRLLHRQGRSIRSIAHELGVSRQTVRKYLREPDKAPVYGPRSSRPSKLDAFKPYLLERICCAAPHWLPATVLLREIQERGYEGGITILKDFLARHKPQHTQPAVVRFETPPGAQAQIDWTVVRRGKNRLSAFVATLGYSRWTFVWFADNERFDTLVDAHKRFFDAIGGVPLSGLYDNMKTVIIDRDTYGPGKHRFNPAFADFAKHHGFIPDMCRPYRAQTKGKVERFNRYLKESFIWPLESRLKPAGLVLDAATANAEVGPWLRNIANARVHATTKEQPQHRFEEEKSFLLPRIRPWNQLSACEQPQAVASMDLRYGLDRLERLVSAPVPQHDLSLYDSLSGEAQAA